VELREERIIVETDRYRLSGVLHIPRDGSRSRMSDFLNESDRTFLAMTDVEIEPVDGREPPARRAFVAVSVDHIVIAMPADAPEEDTAADALAPPAP
jgi:hypothetical protein